MRTTTWVQEDGGLWTVYENGQRIGNIYDQGSKCAATNVTGYDVLESWNGCMPGRKLGEAKHFMQGVAMLRTINRKKLT